LPTGGSAHPQGNNSTPNRQHNGTAEATPDYFPEFWKAKRSRGRQVYSSRKLLGYEKVPVPVRDDAGQGRFPRAGEARIREVRVQVERDKLRRTAR
jgi:hypothetical protein